MPFLMLCVLNHRPEEFFISSFLCRKTVPQHNFWFQKNAQLVAQTFEQLIQWKRLTAKSTISHINYWDQVNSWKSLWKFWSSALLRNVSDPFPLLNVAVCCKSSNTEGCVKKLSRYLQTTMNKEGGWSQNLYEALSKKINEK